MTATANKREKLSVRSGSSRKLLERKAREKAAEAPVALVTPGPDIKALFDEADEALRPASEGAQGVSGAPASNAAGPAPERLQDGSGAPPTAAAASPAQRRNPNPVGSSKEQMIAATELRPNSNTVMSVIVDLVAKAGTPISRAALIAAMQGAQFTHPRARPNDRGWCQGYIVGAVRSGFLSFVDVHVIASGEASR